MRSRVIGAVVAVAVVLVGIAFSPTLGIADLGGGGFSAWLTEVRGDDPDRGWSRLDEETRLIGVCEAGVPVAIGAFEDRRLIGGGGFSGGGVTGSQARCNAAFHGP